MSRKGHPTLALIIRHWQSLFGPYGSFVGNAYTKCWVSYTTAKQYGHHIVQSVTFLMEMNNFITAAH